jgi:two-component system, chemotaxis family, protein-glutamate methylesterase/glutaminase
MVRDIIVIGASAGGIESLEKLIAPLPADLGAALFVVLHISAEHHSILPELLSKFGNLQAVEANDGAPVEMNGIYVAPPDRHLQLEKDRMRVVFGPRENHVRPAIDPLFRTAALAFDSRVIAIILSGTLDDGCEGLVYVRRSGGITIVQEPEDAAFPELPRNALAATKVDFCVPAAQMAGLLKTLLGQSIKNGEKAMLEREPDQDFVGITCPECHGPIFTSKSNDFVRFQCITGHSYSPEAMRAEHRRRVEEALWSAVGTLKEHARLLCKMAQNTPSRAAFFIAEAELKDQHARDLESLVEKFSR